MIFKSSAKLKKPIQTKAPDNILSYEMNDIIFAKGDPGGDLFFIESGRIEIFIESAEQRIVLAEMGPGEILGVMTFLTKDKRLASAKAVEPTKIKKISSNQIQEQVAKFPKWLKIVFKEFLGRITEMNRMYSESSLALRHARQSQISPLFLATQMAQTLGLIAKLPGVKTPDGTVLIDDISTNLQITLNQPKEVVDRLIKVFIDTGLLRGLNDEQKRPKQVSIESLEKAAVFTLFARESAQGRTKKMLDARLVPHEIALIRAVCLFAVKRGFNPHVRSSIPTNRFKAELQEVTGQIFDIKGLDRACEFGLMELTGAGDSEALSLVPDGVYVTLSCIEAMRRFTAPDDDIDVISSKSAA